MKKFKITLLVLYILIVVVLLYEAIIPGDVSSAQHSFIKKVINNISKIFIKKKIINPTEIKVNNDLKETYYTNETLTLDIDVLPSNSSYKTLSFSSSDTHILDVSSSGIITFKNEGVASVIIKQKEGELEKTIDFKVLEYVEPIIEPIEPESVLLKTVDNITSVPVGDVIKFYVEFDKDNINDFNYLFTSSNEDVCKVAGEYIYGLSSGTSTITYTHITTGLTSSVDVVITDGIIVEPTYYRLDGNQEIILGDNTKHIYNVKVNDEASNMYKIYKYVACNSDYVSDKAFMEIDPNTGELTVKKHGIGYVFAYSMDLKIKLSIRVVVKNIMPEFSLDDKRVILGDSYKVSINPTNIEALTYDKYEFKSSNENVAEIDGLGNILTKNTGDATISVILDDGIDRVEKTFVLTVEKKVIEDDIGSSFGKIIRKGIAHFLGFIIFGIVSFMMFYLWIKPNYEGSSKLIILVIAINGLVFAILTEVIQVLSPGRDGTIKDVLLDYFGYTISFILCLSFLLITYLITKKKKKINIS